MDKAKFYLPRTTNREMITELVSTLLEARTFTLPILIEEIIIYILSFVQSLTIHKNSLQDSSSYRSYKHKYSMYLIDTFYPPYLQSYIALIFFIRAFISSNIYIYIDIEDTEDIFY